MLERRLISSFVLAVLAVAGCQKVPITDIEARFDLADAAWFADEETLFFFYELSAEQGISEASVVEVTYRTDDVVLPWTDVARLEPVHTHVPVDCGYERICGSLSLHVPIEPRDVGIRMRYHVDGPLALDTQLVYNVVGSGPPHTNRSFLVYGVFTEDNRRVQWRGRHRFPTLRNEQVTELGLRRAFRIDDQQTGDIAFDTSINPYGYGIRCPDDLAGAELGEVRTEDRAVFNEADLPLSASADALVCARATVHEPKAPFVTSAIARKNPEVVPAFPLLRSPMNEATPIKFYLAPCNRTISPEHDAMQRQRILYGDGPVRCTDDWTSPRFVDDLVVAFRDAIEQTRPAGDDMVLVVGLHRDEDGVAEKLEQALVEVLPPERDRSTPRVVGGFVFDSEIRSIADDRIRRLVLWCPAQVVDEGGEMPAVTELPDPSSVSCAILPDNVNLELGPFSFSALPILPSRDRYLDFIERYSEGQAGKVTELTFLAPELTPTTDNTDLGGAVATFLNGELITAEADDVFSFCEPEMFQTFFVFRSEITKSPDLRCEEGDPEGSLCLPEGVDFLPINLLPEWHELLKEQNYELGLVWDFPWLLRATFEVVAAANASAFGLSVPFGFGADSTQELGTFVWRQSEFSLADMLLQCRRFCDHPTFDSAGIYNVTASFRATYRAACYRPRYPALGDSSFPSDP